MKTLTRAAISLSFGAMAAVATIHAQSWLSSGYPQKYYWDALLILGSLASGNMHLPSSFVMMAFIVAAPALVCFMLLKFFGKHLDPRKKRNQMD